ncbi:PID-CTERM protein-sorting domain-containing protein [Hymenobacter sp.]|uniref:PID-CTERM protein-sorting domain-containing protein n=1 Tax=Hymenobacter sp. TaxID=1898978 RepID=UPI002ED7E893
MKNSGKTTVWRWFLVALPLANAGLVAAQGPGSGGPTPQAPTAVPLDGGASLLLASGLAYGLRRLRQGRNPV